LLFSYSLRFHLSNITFLGRIVNKKPTEVGFLFFVALTRSIS
jgi:hypothetical protein